MTGLALQARRLDAPALSLALIDSRNHTLARYQSLAGALAGRDPAQALPDGFRARFSPPRWRLGHLGWFQQLALACLGQGDRPEAGPWDPQRNPLAQRWTQALPEAQSVMDDLLETLEFTLERLARWELRPPPAAELQAFRLALLHEDLAREDWHEMAQALGLALEPGLSGEAPAALAAQSPLRLGAAEWTLGLEEGGFAWDIEQPARRLPLPAYEIDAQAVSWAAYAEFVADGGYDEPAHWHPEGWQWLQQREPDARRAPRHVLQIGSSGAVLLQRCGQALRVSGALPAQHLSWWEADAWCRWAGRRLPTELEWEQAACVADRRGLRWGEVWEWTGAAARGYPGFEPAPWRAGLADPMPAAGTGRVARGGSHWTPERVRHPRYRRLLPAGHTEAFTGFRSVALD
ncbi:MAG: hypothetical protein FGM55_14195 [Rhodoferax sp.]|nr:hypothetical protein [Rhodoferax sp.]